MTELKYFQIGEYALKLLHDSEKGVYICHNCLVMREDEVEAFLDYVKGKYSSLLRRDFISKSREHAEQEMRKRIQLSLDEYFKEEKEVLLC
ncbi:MAG: hypothetical protein IJM79_02290 [Erysipelotrichaceae bacterium]|nr:hypothetical protein [Erysipelotrichaceae bacterium]